MRFWPFGKDNDANADGIDFGSRVVTGAARDGRQARAKVTAAFKSPLSQEAADQMMDRCAVLLRAAFEDATTADELVGAESDLARRVNEQLSDARSIDIVALHIVGESSDAPPTRRPFSEPPRTNAPRSQTPPTTRRASSSQMLAVRDSRLIPEGATAEACAAAIVPLLRDAGTRVLVGILRAYDLLVVREIKVDKTTADDFGELVPLSRAAPGRFADERREELARWEDKLGAAKVTQLRNDASAVVCFFLHVSLERVGLATSTAVTLLEAGAQLAFPDEGAVAAMPRYFGMPDPAEALASRALEAFESNRSVLAGFALAMTPVLASLQEDFAFTAQQIKLSGIVEKHP